MNLSQLRGSLGVCLLLASGAARAAPGDFDPSFNRLGFTRDAVADSSTVASGVAIHASGEIVSSGHYGDLGSARLVLWRHLPDGTLDAILGGTGIVYPPSPTDLVASDSLAIDQLDRIVLIATTSTSYVIHRFNFDGSADVSFSGTGSVTIPTGTAPYPITAIAIYPDNKILGVGGALATPSRFIIYRLEETGELDSSFGGTGLVFTEISPGFGADRATGVVLQADSKIVVAGRARTLPSLCYDVALARYLPSGQLQADGSLDQTFGLNGISETNYGYTYNVAGSIRLQADGRMVVSGDTSRGDSNYRAVTARYLAK